MHRVGFLPHLPLLLYKQIKREARSLYTQWIPLKKISNVGFIVFYGSLSFDFLKVVRHLHT